MFMLAGGYDHKDWWPPAGWAWRLENQRTAPNYWSDQTTHESRNQPIYGVSWYEAVAFCGWLNATQNRYIVRLPTEAEWEVVAAYDAPGEQHTYPWGDAAITLERAIYNEHRMQNRPAPVGTCVAGTTANGALDMGGNLWEWTHTGWENYPGGANKVDIIFDGISVSTRGGSWVSGPRNARSASRHGSGTYIRNVNLGLRLVCALPV